MMAVACSSSPNMKRRFFHNNCEDPTSLHGICMLHVTVSHTVQVVRHVTANRPTRKSEFDYECTY